MITDDCNSLISLLFNIYYLVNDWNIFNTFKKYIKFESSKTTNFSQKQVIFHFNILKFIYFTKAVTKVTKRFNVCPKPVFFFSISI